MGSGFHDKTNAFAHKSTTGEKDSHRTNVSNSPPAPTPRLPKRLALASYSTFFAAVLLVVIAGSTESHVLLTRVAALLLLNVGLACGILAVLYAAKAAGRSLLWRPSMGALANLVLLAAVIPGFSNEIRQGIGPKLHLGTWDTQTPEGVRQTWTFTGTRFTLENGRRSSLKTSELSPETA